MLLLWIAIIILSYYVFSASITQRRTESYLRNLNDAQQQFNFNLTSAVYQNKYFLQALGFSENYSNLNTSDKRKFKKILAKNNISEKIYSKVAYFPVGDFFLTRGSEGTYPTLSQFTKRTLYSVDLLSTPEEKTYTSSNKEIELIVVERPVIKDNIRLITGYLRFTSGFVMDIDNYKRHTELLFNFPYQIGATEEQLRKHGFTVEYSSGGPYPSDLQDRSSKIENQETWDIAEYTNSKGVKITNFFE